MVRRFFQFDRAIRSRYGSSAGAFSNGTNSSLCFRFGRLRCGSRTAFDQVKQAFVQITQNQVDNAYNEILIRKF